MKRRRVGLALLLASLPTLALSACNGELLPERGVILQMQTDMVVPDYVKKVGLFVDRIDPDGRRVTVAAHVVAQHDQSVRLPSSISIEGNGKPNVRAQIRLVAFGELDAVVSMREARVIVPEAGVKNLRMSLLWMNNDDVNDSAPGSAADADYDPFTRFVSLCGPEQTRNDLGDCVSIDDGAAPYEPTTETFEPTEQCNADCFDVDYCFPADGLDSDDENFRSVVGSIQKFGEECGLPLGRAGQRALSRQGGLGDLAAKLAVAVRVPVGSGGYCLKEDPDTCYIVPDGAAGVRVGERDGKPWAFFPRGVCRNIDKLTRGIVRASPRCERKRPDQPICQANQYCHPEVHEGWNGTRDPEAPPIPEPTTVNGCKPIVLDSVVSLWAEGATVVALGRRGGSDFWQVERRRLEGNNCIVEEPRDTALSISVVSPRIVGGGGGGDRLAIVGDNGFAALLALSSGSNTSTYEISSPMPTPLSNATMGMTSDEDSWMLLDSKEGLFVGKSDGYSGPLVPSLIADQSTSVDFKYATNLVSSGVNQYEFVGFGVNGSVGAQLGACKYEVPLTGGCDIKDLALPTGVELVPRLAASLQSRLFVLGTKNDTSQNGASSLGAFVTQYRKLPVAGAQAMEVSLEKSPLSADLVSSAHLVAAGPVVFVSAGAKIYRITAVVTKGELGVVPMEVLDRSGVVGPIAAVWHADGLRGENGGRNAPGKGLLYWTERDGDGHPMLKSLALGDGVAVDDGSNTSSGGTSSSSSGNGSSGNGSSGNGSSGSNSSTGGSSTSGSSTSGNGSSSSGSSSSGCASSGGGAPSSGSPGPVECAEL